MENVTIRLQDDTSSGSCGLCGRRTVHRPGPALCVDAGDGMVCRDCGKKYAPALAALLDLADVAQKVGRIARHTIVPSLGTLLDLARAAENYTFVAAEEARQAA